ncbi:MAG: hypothetical protein IPJ65_42875 [Archangiaceae bacterium]|nr:hypothetical protein [Archangiaceae bacterium]
MNALKAIGNFLVSGTGRRLLVFLLGFLVTVLNKKLGLDLDAEQLVAEIVLVCGYFTQSAVKEASDAHADAKTALADAAKAAAANPPSP